MVSYILMARSFADGVDLVLVEECVLEVRWRHAVDADAANGAGVLRVERCVELYPFRFLDLSQESDLRNEEKYSDGDDAKHDCPDESSLTPRSLLLLG